MSRPLTSGPAPAPPPNFFASVGALVFSRGFVMAGQVLVLPVLARYLTVDEFALMALAMSVVIFTGVLSDAGLGRSLIRTKQFDAAEWSSVFWLMVGVGLCLSVGVLMIAPLWAWFFDAPELWALISALAVVPLCQAVSSAHGADLERRERYTLIAKLQTAAAMVGLVTVVILALLGAGVWALVVQQILYAAIRLAGLLHWSNFKPRFEFHRARLAGHVQFAWHSVSTSLISVAQKEGVTMIIGKMLGPTPLGIFAMSQRFTRLPQFGLAGPASAVVYVRMSKVQDSPEKLLALYLGSARLLSAIILPPLAMIAAAGSVIFTVLLSDSWASVAPVFAYSIPGIALEAVTITCLVCVFRATARTDLQMRLIIEGTAVLLPLALLASFQGVETVAMAFSLWALFYVPRGWRLARAVIPLTLKAGVGAIILPILASVAGAVAYLSIWQTSTDQPVAQIATAAGITLMIYAFVALLDWSRLRAAIDMFR